jgi:hypothetical protein
MLEAWDLRFWTENRKRETEDSEATKWIPETESC